jgi:hypothetical protein
MAKSHPPTAYHGRHPDPDIPTRAPDLIHLGRVVVDKPSTGHPDNTPDPAPPMGGNPAPAPAAMKPGLQSAPASQPDPQPWRRKQG